MIKTLIFDLDYCLLDLTKIEDYMGPVYEAIDGFCSEKERAEGIKNALWGQNSFQIIRDEYRISDEFAQVINEAYKTVETRGTEPVLYDDYVILEKLPQYKILVTTGFIKLQSSKIKRTWLDNMMNEIIIDSVDNPAQRLGKEKIFRDILTRLGQAPQEIAVLGDSAQSELRVGKELGMVTIQTLRPNVARGDGFDYYITSLHELPDIVGT